MAENGSPPPSSKPTISLPPRASMESFLKGGNGLSFDFSPGPMTLVSSLFADNDDCKSFSQLLAGAVASPSSGVARRLEESEIIEQRWSDSSAIEPPGRLLDSPGFFSLAQGPFGMTHQQALEQFTVQAVQSHSLRIQPDHHSSSSSIPKKFSDITEPDQISQPSSCSVDKPADDGYNWRKYGQKQVKGSEFPRSYYKCTKPSCPVKKKVERSANGHVTEIIYKGQHNHQPPLPNKRAKGSVNSDGNTVYPVSRKDQGLKQPTQELSGSSDSDEVVETENDVDGEDENEPDPKRRNSEIRVWEPSSSQKAVTEPKIIVQTTSEIDLLDDGYRWRKYGQKIVKGNPYPRSYYKCTTPGCNVKKHIERAASDRKSVITTYEGKHNHDVPMAKTYGHNGFPSDEQRSTGSLLVKKEEIK